MKKLFQRRKIISDKNRIQRNQITYPTPNFESFISTDHSLSEELTKSLINNDELKKTNINLNKNIQQKDLEISNLKIEVDEKNNEIFDLRKRMEESEKKFFGYKK